MPAPTFRFVSVPSAISGAPAGWAGELLRNGEIAVLAAEGLEPINELAHQLGQSAIGVIRSEQDAEAQDRTVIAYADSLPLIWVAPGFSPAAADWARERGPMTLLVEAGEPLSDEERRRIDRFVAILGRQSE